MLHKRRIWFVGLYCLDSSLKCVQNLPLLVQHISMAVITFPLAKVAFVKSVNDVIVLLF
jgi:hypothetical protein